MINVIGRSALYAMLMTVGFVEFILGFPHWRADSKDKLNLVITMVVMGAFVVIGNILVYFAS